MAYCNLDKVIYEGAGKFDIPQIEPVKEVKVKTWLGFNYCKKEEYCSDGVGVHFCLDDYQFETLWNHPKKYIDNFRRCSAIVSPDFSLYSDFPLAIQIYNHYRKHWLAKFYQDRGVTVIPTIGWSDEKSYDWCFDGEPKHSVVAVGTSGCFNNDEATDFFMQGYDEMMRRLKPSKIIVFTLMDDVQDKINLKGNVNYVNISTYRRNKEKLKEDNADLSEV